MERSRTVATRDDQASVYHSTQGNGAVTGAQMESISGIVGVESVETYLNTT